ncbi:MAG TPA: VTT domain-containing protein [Polyangiaceae bacterium]|nr:VTT domain-containing protein [Polyangiaceae bacterium]
MNGTTDAPDAAPDRPSDLPPNSERFIAEEVRKNVLWAGVSLLLLAVLAGTLTLLYGEQLARLSEWLFGTLGLGGMLVFLFLAETVVSPFPPDSLLILIASSDYHESWPVVIPAMGLVSAVAGWCGYFCGRVLARTRWADVLFGRFKRKSQDFIQRMGPTAVALGALTPLPFSLTCWTAGLLGVPFSRIWALCLLRIPRYVVYYVVVAYAESVFRWL